VKKCVVLAIVVTTAVSSVLCALPNLTNPSLYGQGLVGSCVAIEVQKVLGTVDINHDGTVNFLDFAQFASK
jgi:hypothetical protein